MTGYPLAWPIGWKRAQPSHRKDAKFSKKIYQASSMPGGSGYYRSASVTVAEGTKRVLDELDRMGILSNDIVISTNLELRQDGLPRSNQRAPDDPGVAVYWKNRKDAQHKVMAIDLYSTVADNLAAVAATLDAMRAIERHGGAVILERAFTGFAALPAPNTWRAVLGFTEDALPTLEQVKREYRMHSMGAHPDKTGGDDAAQKELNWAMQEAERELGR